MSDDIGQRVLEDHSASDGIGISSAGAVAGRSTTGGIDGCPTKSDLTYTEPGVPSDDIGFSMVECIVRGAGGRRHRLRRSGTRSPSAAPQSELPDVFAELAARPLVIPSASDDECRVTLAAPIDDRVAPAMGDGPIHAVLGGTDGVWSIQGQDPGPFERYSLKTLWISTDPADERILLRIFGFDPDAPVPGFSHGVVVADDGVGTQLRLGPRGSVIFGPGPNPEGWRAWSSAALVPGPGCYAFQVDTVRATEHLYFGVVP